MRALLNSWDNCELQVQQEASSITRFLWMALSDLKSGTCTGPDVQRDHQITLKSNREATVYLDFFASELRLRGNAPVAQPHTHECGNVLCWNGEVSNRSLIWASRSCSSPRKDLQRAGCMFSICHTETIDNSKSRFIPKRTTVRSFLPL